MAWHERRVRDLQLVMIPTPSLPPKPACTMTPGKHHPLPHDGARNPRFCGCEMVWCVEISFTFNPPYKCKWWYNDGQGGTVLHVTYANMLHWPTTNAPWQPFALLWSQCMQLHHPTRRWHTYFQPSSCDTCPTPLPNNSFHPFHPRHPCLVGVRILAHVQRWNPDQYPAAVAPPKCSSPQRWGAERLRFTPTKFRRMPIDWRFEKGTHLGSWKAIIPIAYTHHSPASHRCSSLCRFDVVLDPVERHHKW